MNPADDAWAEYRRTRTDEARRTVAGHYLYLVRRVAREMIRRGMPQSIDFGDLVGWGTVGLIAAISNYDPDAGTPFRVYATYRIYGAIRSGLRDGWDHLPRKVRRQVRSGERTDPKRTFRKWHSLPDPHDDADELERRDELDALPALLAKLDERSRDIAVMVGIAGFPTRTVGAMVGCTHSCVVKVYGRAVKAMREMAA
jgi:RNA polymerase sigma factor (sigma-70 family)